MTRSVLRLFVSLAYWSTFIACPFICAAILTWWHDGYAFGFATGGLSAVPFMAFIVSEGTVCRSIADGIYDALNDEDPS